MANEFLYKARDAAGNVIYTASREDTDGKPTTRVELRGSVVEEVFIDNVAIRDLNSTTSSIKELGAYKKVYFWVINNTDQDMKVTVQPAVDNAVTPATPKIFDGTQFKDIDSVIIPKDQYRKPVLLNTVSDFFDISFYRVRFSVRSNGVAPTTGNVRLVGWGVK